MSGAAVTGLPARQEPLSAPSPARTGRRNLAEARSQAGISAERIQPIARGTLPMEIVNAIGHLMMQGVWRPGDMIPSEKELAQRFGVGRSTVREAVKSLVVLGALEARVGEGSFVREPTAGILTGAFRWGLLLGERNMGDLVAVRTLVETDCAGRAAEARTEADLARLLGLNARMAGSGADHGAFMAADNAFHIEIARIAGNVLLQSISSTIQTMVGIWYPPTYYQPDVKGVTIAEHAAIADAIGKSDAAAAAEAMRTHIANAAERLKRVMG